MLFIPYIMFKGNAKEAMDFYANALGATSQNIMLYSDGQGMEIPDDYKDKIMHAELEFSGGIIYLSDAFPGTEVKYNDSISFNVGPDSEEELERLFAAFSDGGKIVQPLEESFWGAKFGSLDDRFGIHWSFNYVLPQE